MARFCPVALVLVGLVAGVGLAADEPETAPPPPPADFFGGPFSLIDHHGTRRTEQDFRGRYMLIYFGYATCPDICPTGLQTLSTALDLLGARADAVQPLFITVDPARDRPQALKDYVSHFHPRLIGLTGAESEIRAVAKAYRIHRRKVVLADSAGPDDYLVDHASITHLMGPDGKHVTLFPHGTDAERMAEVLRRYLP